MARALLVDAPVGRTNSITIAMMLAACTDPSEYVGDDIAHVAATVTCTPLDGARVLGASANGELWLATASATRVIDLDGERAVYRGALDAATAVQPWSASAASAIMGGEVWSIDEDAREYVATPALGAARDLCGVAGAAHGSFVITNSVLERSGDVWWEWEPGGATGFGQPAEIARVDGACTARDDVAWIRTSRGDVWSISQQRIERVVRDAEALAIVDGDGVAIRSAERLELGPPWREVVFSAGPPVHAASSGSALWVIAGDAVLVREHGDWRAVDNVDSAPLRVFADAAGGAWIEHADQVCRAQIAPPIRVAGLAPFERRAAPFATLEISPLASAERVTIDRDGEQVADLAVSDGVAQLPDLALGAPGWHALSIRAGDATRELPYNVVELARRSWATEVAPVFAARCASCHAPGAAQIDLSTYDSWRTRAGRIRERVVRGDMPPGEPLSTEHLAIVLDWIEGGMQP